MLNPTRLQHTTNTTRGPLHLVRHFATYRYIMNRIWTCEAREGAPALAIVTRQGTQFPRLCRGHRPLPNNPCKYCQILLKHRLVNVAFSGTPATASIEGHLTALRSTIEPEYKPPRHSGTIVAFQVASTITITSDLSRGKQI